MFGLYGLRSGLDTSSRRGWPWEARRVAAPTRAVTNPTRPRSPGWMVGHSLMEKAMIRDTDSREWADLVVVGGGLAGLAASALVAREGRSVVVLEKAARPGG